MVVGIPHRASIPKPKSTVSISVSLTTVTVSIGWKKQEKNRDQLGSQRSDRFHVQIPIGRNAQVFLTEPDFEKSKSTVSISMSVIYDGDRRAKYW